MTNLKYFKSLDGIRALAAFAVIFCHFFHEGNTFGNIYFLEITKLGNSGVSLFFVLSGFVITRILLNSRESNSYFQTFYLRRLLRIAPLYYFGLVFYYLYPILLDEKYHIPKFSEQIYYWTYLQNFARTFTWPSSGPGHFWSLAVEEHFYLIWPAIIYFAFLFHGKFKNLIYVCIFIIISSGILRFLMSSKGYEINVFTFTRLDQLAMGCILALLELKGYLKKTYFKVYFSLFVFGLFAIFGVSLLNFVLLNTFKHYAFGICYFGLIGFSAIGSDQLIFNKIMNINFIQYLGKISYGIYIWHMLAINLLIKFSTHFVLIDLALVIIITIVIATLSYYFLEKPFLKLKKYTSYS